MLHITQFPARIFNLSFYRIYDNIVVPESKGKPYILLFYADWCVACAHIEPIWKRLVEELEPINFGMNTVSLLDTLFSERPHSVLFLISRLMLEKKVNWLVNLVSALFLIC